MKKLLSVVFLFVIIGSLAALLKTSLTITVRDDKGNVVSGASIKIYSNQENWQKEVNPILEGTTDEKGVAKFKEVGITNAYILIRKDDMDNTGGGEMTKLEAGKYNKITVIIQ